MIVQKETTTKGRELFGSSDHISVDRALAEFRCGRPVIFESERETLIALPVEKIDAARCAAFAACCAPAAPFLAVTRQRAEVLGLPSAGPLALKLKPVAGADDILSLAAAPKIDIPGAPEPLAALALGPAADAALTLAKLLRFLPAVLAAPADGAAMSLGDNAFGDMAFGNMALVRVRAQAVDDFRSNLAASLKMTVEADVPLQDGVTGRFVVFTDLLGRTQTAVVVGVPNFTKPVPVRLHSACLTGDVFGSRRCDCGDQLRLSLKRLHEAGGGVVLYLAQEGRGLGLANKIRAYRLQDEGLDTMDANTTLGFEHDERDYSIAAAMLKMLGCRSVLLLSNNPAKISGLDQSGIEVAGHMPLVAPVTADNRRYLATKAARAGHRLDVLGDDLNNDSGFSP